MKFINIPVFIISLTLGIFFVYISNPRPNVIYVYPNPDNLNDIQYKDRTESCFGFSSKEVACPSNQKDIRTYPIQEGKIKQL
jgi:hypothetical protein